MRSDSEEFRMGKRRENERIGCGFVGVEDNRMYIPLSDSFMFLSSPSTFQKQHSGSFQERHQKIEAGKAP